MACGQERFSPVDHYFHDDFVLRNRDRCSCWCKYFMTIISVTLILFEIPLRTSFDRNGISSVKSEFDILSQVGASLAFVIHESANPHIGK